MSALVTAPIPITVGSVVRATRQIIDDQDPHETWPDDAILDSFRRLDGLTVAAELGDLGRVLHVEGEQLIVHFENAPVAISVFTGDDVVPLLTLLQGGIVSPRYPADS